MRVYNPFASFGLNSHKGHLEISQFIISFGWKQAQSKHFIKIDFFSSFISFFKFSLFLFIIFSLTVDLIRFGFTDYFEKIKQSGTLL